MSKHIFKYILVLASVFAAAGCGTDGFTEPDTDPPVVTPPPEPEPEPEPENLEFTSFSFRRSLNDHQLLGTVECVISERDITAHIRYANDLSEFIPTFRGDFAGVFVNGERQQSDVTPQDFSKAVLYTLVDSHGYERTYRVVIKTGSGLPLVRISTDDGAPVASKTEYTRGTMEITNIPEFGGRFDGSIGIRGRGNATWSYEKKPYRIKLDKKASLMGFPAHKDWVLLAEYCDKSLLRNTYLWELSKIAGIDRTCRARHVELTLNGDYLGTYLLCENVGEGEGRVPVAADGFIIERDNYWNTEPLWFGTTYGNYTFKYPDARDGDIVKDDADYNYILNFMRQFETALSASTFADPKTGYRNYIDAESFARWYLVQELLGNIDTNSYYVLETRGAKLKMYPVWDAEWCLGCAAVGSNGWATPPAVSPVDKLYWKESVYFSRLIRDPWFCDLLRSEWARIKARLPELEANIGSVAGSLQYAQADNFKRWNVLGHYVSAGLLNFPTWKQEVGFATDFLGRRAAWLDTRLRSFPN